MHGLGEFGMQLQLPVLAVDRNEVFRFDQVNDQFQFFLAGVAAHVNWWRGSVFVDDVCLAPEQVIDHAIDRLLIAGNDAGGKHNRVAFFDLGMFVIVYGSTRQRRHRFALCAANEHTNFFRSEILHLTRMNQQTFGNLDIAQVFSDLRRTGHGPANERNFAPVLPGEFYRELNAMNRRRKTRNKQPALGAGKNFIELAAHRPLTGRVTFALNIGAVLKQGQHALFTVFGKCVKIKEPVVGGRGINFEVAGVNDHAERRVDRQRNAIHQAVRYLNGMNSKRSYLEALAWTNLAQVRAVEEAMFIQLVLDVGKRELRSPHRDVQLGKDPWQGANVILVAVSQNNPAHMLSVFGEIRNFGDNNVHAQKFGLGEHKAGIDDDNVIASEAGHAVHAELAQPAERHDVEFSGWHWKLSDASTADTGN